MHHYAPESKQATIECRKEREPSLVKTQTRLSIDKLLITVFCVFRGDLRIDFLMNIAPSVSCTIASFWIGQKKAGFSNTKRHCCASNARPNIVFQKRKKCYDLFWIEMEHHSYGPDLSPCNYHIFSLIKEESEGHGFDNDAAVEMLVHLKKEKKNYLCSGKNVLWNQEII